RHKTRSRINGSTRQSFYAVREGFDAAQLCGGMLPLQRAAYNFPSLARANTSSSNFAHAQATDAEANGIRLPSGVAGQPTDSKPVQSLPFHHLCNRSPRWPRAKTSRRVEPPPAQTGAPERGTGTFTAG